MIVVLVILAILAAMMVPALLGWIDEARNKQYVLEARSIYMAAQAIADEEYAKSEAVLKKSALTGTEGLARIIKLAEVTVDAAGLKNISVESTAAGDQYTPKAFKIIEMEITFTSANGSTINAALEDGAWRVSVNAALDPAVDTDSWTGTVITG